jgi:hypothetical protein
MEFLIPSMQFGVWNHHASQACLLKLKLKNILKVFSHPLSSFLIQVCLESKPFA